MREGSEDPAGLGWSARKLLEAMADEDAAAVEGEGGGEEAVGGVRYGRMILGGFGQVIADSP